MADLFQETLAPLYRNLRRLKNRWCNLIDPPVIVLGYHRVARLDSDPHLIAVSPENFRAQMHYLRENFACLRLDQVGKGLTQPAVVITFDDGYADNLHQALPILEEAGVPATFFIATGMLDSDLEFWSDELERILLCAKSLPPCFALKDHGSGGVWETGSPSERQQLHQVLHRMMLGVDSGRRSAWLEELSQWAGSSRQAREGYRALTRDELRELAAHPLVSIGAHGVSHTPLSLLDVQEQRREILQSRDALARLVSRPVAAFSYPFGGRGQFDASTGRICREAGFDCAVTTFPGQVHRWTSRWRMPRQLVRNWGGDEFAARMRGFWT